MVNSIVKKVLVELQSKSLIRVIVGQIYLCNVPNLIFHPEKLLGEVC